MYSEAESVEFTTVGIVGAPLHVIEALQLPGHIEVIQRSRLISHETEGPRCSNVGVDRLSDLGLVASAADLRGPSPATGAG